MMERAEWLQQMRSKAEGLYDKCSPKYWVTWGLRPAETHQEFLQKFLARIRPGGTILSAACGAGRFDGILIEAGHSVVGIDQSAGMLARAREHFPVEQFPQLRYEKLGLQEIAQHPDYREAFDGVICMDAMEHICPEDWPGIMQGFAWALKPGGVLYFTADTLEGRDAAEVEASYQRSKAAGLPVVFGEIADEVDTIYNRVIAQPGLPKDEEVGDTSVYHYLPSAEQVLAWLNQAGMVVEEENVDNEYHHFLARKIKE